MPRKPKDLSVNQRIRALHAAIERLNKSQVTAVDNAVKNGSLKKFARDDRASKMMVGPSYRYEAIMPAGKKVIKNVNAMRKKIYDLQYRMYAIAASEQNRLIMKIDDIQRGRKRR